MAIETTQQAGFETPGSLRVGPQVDPRRTRQEQPMQNNGLVRRKLLVDSLRFALLSAITTSGGIGAYVTLLNNGAAERDQRFAHKDGTYAPLPPVAVEGKKLGLVGVNHTESVFVRYEETIRDRIRASQSPFVVLEYFDEDAQRIARPVEGRVSEYLQRENPAESAHDFTSNFYGGIGSICAKEGKDIVLVNPHTPSGLTEYVDAYLVFGVLPALGITDVAGWLRKKNTETISRRNLLLGGIRKAAYAVAAYDLASILGIPQSLIGAIDKETGDALGWNLIDWRDCMSARGIRRAFDVYGSEFSPDTVVPMFQGVQHDRMLTYLEHPQVARTKANLLYQQYHFLGDQSVRRYTYDKRQEKWKEVAKIAI